MATSDFTATIVAGGQRYTTWKSVMVRRDYGNAISTFEFTAAEPGGKVSGYSNVKLKPGDPCQIYLGSDKVIDGNITTRSVSYDRASHDLVVAGKSTSDNLRSAVKIMPGGYSGSTFEQATRSVLQQVGVGLVIQNPPSIASKPFGSLYPQFGETCLEFVERLARLRGFFLTDDANGNLVASQLDPSAAPVAELQEGRNILRCVCTLDNQTLWSGLSAVGQQTGSDGTWPPRDYSATATIPNSGVNRQVNMIAEHCADGQDCQQRINFEVANAAWGNVDCQITVVGWHKDSGALWLPTENVSVLSPMAFPSQTGATILGIQAVVYQQDDKSGTTTTLHLKQPGALSTLPNPFSQTAYGGPTPNAQVDSSDTMVST